MLSGEAAYTNFNVFGLTRPGIEPTTFRIRGEHANHYTTEAVRKIYVILSLIAAHTNNHATAESGFSNSIHPELKTLIKQHVEIGLTSVPYLRRVLRQHVKKNLCSDPDMVDPVDTDRAYFPTS